jgi:transcriptional regulator with XRE-family HTH domain
MILKEYIEEKKITQADFGHLVGVSHVQIHRLIHGKRTPSFKLAKRIEKVTGGLVTTDDYLIED